jgi:hypothetical protein
VFLKFNVDVGRHALALSKITGQICCWLERKIWNGSTIHPLLLYQFRATNTTLNTFIIYGNLSSTRLQGHLLVPRRLLRLFKNQRSGDWLLKRTPWILSFLDDVVSQGTLMLLSSTLNHHGCLLKVLLRLLFQKV